MIKYCGRSWLPSNANVRLRYAEDLQITEQRFHILDGTHAAGGWLKSILIINTLKSIRHDSPRIHGSAIH
jgi:hypothetical protein